MELKFLEILINIFLEVAKFKKIKAETYEQLSNDIFFDKKWISNNHSSKSL